MYLLSAYTIAYPTTLQISNHIIHHKIRYNYKVELNAISGINLKSHALYFYDGLGDEIRN